MPIRLAPLAEADPAQVEALLDAAFGADRRARTAYRLREGLAWLPDLSFAAFESGEMVGSLQSWPIALDGAPLTLVGPVAVAPARQNSGIGRALMHSLLVTAPSAPMAMIGDPDYYGRFGFTAENTAGWQVPGPVEGHRLLARNVGRLPRLGRLAPRPMAGASAAA